MFNKFFKKETLVFPPTLSFGGKQGPVNYKIVSVINHAGNQSGGHYWADSMRRASGRTVLPARLNDSQVSVGSLRPTANSYIMFYHYVD
jgi:ubiquitin C-terminal hydrolase